MSHIQGETVADIESQVVVRMKKTLEDLHREMATIRTGKASPTILDGVRVNYYGTPTPLNQLANMSAPESSLILVQPWDVSQIDEIEKAILSSGLGLNPSNDGKVIRIIIPALTEERRKDLVKLLHQVVEQHRVAARTVRRDANDALKQLEKDKKISEDDSRRGQESVQKKTSEIVADLDKAGSVKEQEIMAIG
ncbi:MAG: ribosome recycling factor [Solibacterales bacterium]|nr:ribosome recycling factor [Bryobacterales bacterium]|tara:strand:+ start:583 stop:1164 length:582 start_codon:yes stop_codon:yes gene_type:complete